MTGELKYQKNIDRSNCFRSRGQQKMGSSLSCVGVFWTLLSFLSSCSTFVGFYMPYWLSGSLTHNTPTYVGVFRRCNYLALNSKGHIEVILECGRYTTFLDIPSLWWQVATITIGVGCGLTILVTVIAVLACCIKDAMTQTVAKIAGVLQLFAGILIGVGCAIYPLGWSNREIHQMCGNTADVFILGNCQMCWAYYATMAGGAGALFCALLSCHAAKPKISRFRS